jgi:hypothetical protein
VDGPILKASVIQPAAVTHSSDPNQRYIGLPMTVTDNTIGLNLTSACRAPGSPEVTGQVVQGGYVGCRTSPALRPTTPKLAPSVP